MVFLPNVLNFFSRKKSPEPASSNNTFIGSGQAHARLGGSGDNGSKWFGGLSSYIRSTFLNNYVLRQNARYAYQNTPMAKAIVDRNADVVADIGLMLEAAPVAEELGISPEEAESWAVSVERKFDLWARSKKQHRAELMTWYQSHRLYQIMAMRDGETFPRFFYTNDKDALNKLQFEFIDQNQIRGDSLTNSLGIQTTNDGIVRDSRNRETAYLIWSQDKDGAFIQQTIQKKGPRSGRIFMLHGFAPEYPMQRRGFSRLSHVLQEFENLTDFKSSVIKKAINQSNITMFVEPSKDFDSSTPLKNISNTRAGPSQSANQFGVNPQTGAAEDLGPVVEFCRLDEATVDVPGSTGIFNLKRGETIKPFPNTSPGESYPDFVSSFAGSISASTSTPLEVVLMKFNQNYSASRATLILFWRVAGIWREEMASDFLNPTYTMWLAEEIAAGRVTAPGWSNPRMRAAWSNARWIGSPMPNIDPSKTAKAIKDHLEMGLTDLDKESRILNGSVGSMNRVRLNKQLDDLPNVPWGKNGGKNGQSNNSKLPSKRMDAD